MTTGFQNIQETMRSVREQYLSVLEHGKVIFFIITEEGQIEYVSDYLDDILHFKPKEVIGNSIFDLTDPESVTDLRVLIQRATASPNEAIHFSDLGLFCTQCYRHYFDGTILKTEDRLALHLHDVTARKMEAEKLAQTNLELDSFIYKASHDLRSPLLSIAGLIDLTETSVKPESQDYLQLMRKSVDRLNKFITQLAHYTRNNNISINYERIDFETLFQDVVDTYRFLPGAEKIDFQVNIESEEETYSDSFRLKIILNNIVSNAIKHHHLSQEKPFIGITLQSDREKYIIRVEDNGPGIRPSALQEIFGMFARATDKAEGSGLGLYIVKKALEKIYGQVNVESKLGEGTAFIIEIPNMVDLCQPQEGAL